jgi:hypothetical protein
MDNRRKFTVNAKPLFFQFNSNGYTVGELKENDGKIDFSGDASASAKVFFDHMERELQGRVATLAQEQKGIPEEVSEFLSLVMSGTNQGLRKRALELTKKYGNESAQV